MVATAPVPLEPAVTQQRTTRILTIAADLLPAEIVAARRARRGRAGVLVVLALVVPLLAGWYLHANNEHRAAVRDLAEVTTRAAATQRSQSLYREVVEVRSETATLTTDLRTVMATDLPYATLLKSLRTTGTAAGVTVEGVTAALDTADPTVVPGSVLPSDEKAVTVGTLVIAGTAPDKKSVAAYADKLATLAGVADPYVTTVSTTTNEAGLSFSLSAAIAAAAVCGRFTTACKTTGGK